MAPNLHSASIQPAPQEAVEIQQPAAGSRVLHAVPDAPAAVVHDSEKAQAEVAPEPAALPAMSDLDRLQAELDLIDATLLALDS